MKLFNSKSGFTLIELLVVIGILAVLAAIAIPSVAGLIDRANVSADKTNANEMTNAVERFAAEYELYCQDVASGLIDANTTDFDAAQGRVLNVTGIRCRDDITAFEGETGFDGKGINRDTKYPANEATLKSIVENYTKTSSATFAPKQSDHEFYYSPEVGLVIVGETGATIDELNAVAFASEDDIAQFDAIAWICLDGEVDNIATTERNVSATLETEIVVPTVHSFTIRLYSTNTHTFKEEVTLQYKTGMTWGQWVNSEYNTKGFYLVTLRNGIEYVVAGQCAEGCTNDMCGWTEERYQKIYINWSNSDIYEDGEMEYKTMHYAKSADVISFENPHPHTPNPAAQDTISSMWIEARNRYRYESDEEYDYFGTWNELL